MYKQVFMVDRWILSVPFPFLFTQESWHLGLICILPSSDTWRLWNSAVIACQESQA